jgi:hypothetical protein
MLVPGYVLAITREHHVAFADVPADTLTEMGAQLDDMISVLEGIFGEYFAFEHGGGVTCHSGSCIDHAHLHLVPLAATLGQELVGKLQWDELSAIGDLHQLTSASYVYLYQRGHHFVARDPGFPSQWLRRQIATFIGSDLWDWAVDPGTGNLGVTRAALRAATSVPE